ncbi:PucR family transcriptional regulator [Mycolicibacterium fluoranthenivorans]|uniref:PucR family transcriptional regulator n=1 Tax=Mycolicibacterium fluoranthenivorans TaxID=258505 RepID=UPI0021F366CE|nr:helix-turn-helix domain-containing protein [Mycolicibacterium fluoranthenivorans]
MSAWMSALRPSQPAASDDLEPVSLPETVARARAVLGDEPTAWAIQRSKQICDTYEASVRADPTITGDGLDRVACEAALLTVLVNLRTGRAEAPAPPEGFESVRRAVRQGARIETILRVVWFSHTAAQMALLEVLSREVPAERLADELRAVSVGLFEFVDGLVGELATAYDQERAAWHGRLAALRRQTMDHIVEHGTAPDGSEQLLGIRLRGDHLAAVIRSVDPAPPTGWDGNVTRYVAAVSATIEALNSLVLDQPDGSTVIWSLSAAPRDPVSVVTDRVPHPPGSIVAFGPVGRDVAGLQSSVLGARQAALVGGQHQSEGSWTYDDVGLQAVLLADPEAAGRYVRHVLKGLTDGDAKSAMLRETLWAYLRHGRSRLAAAEELHIAPNTVAYRVRQADERLERPALDDPTPMVVALSLARDFPALLG